MVKGIRIESLTKASLTEKTEYVLKNISLFQTEGYSEFLFFSVKLVIWEIFCNLIEHGGEIATHWIDIEVEEFENQLILSIYSNGSGFSWESYKNIQCPEISRIGGRGLYLIQQVCDFTYDESGRNAKAIFNIVKS
jgi:anti-sigma regulatory factor (Ser/Thr protein kinase)